MNANVAGGVGGEDEGSLPDDLMAQTVTETVYLGRASFRITHEIEAVQADEPASDSSTWFSHNAAVILKGGPSGLAMRRLPATELSPEGEQLDTRLGRWLRPWWLLVALPMVAFALGMVVAPLAGSSALRHKTEPTAVAVQAPVARTIAPPATAAPAVSVPAQVPATEVVAAPAPVVAAPALAAPATAAPAAALPPSTVAAVMPVADTVTAPLPAATVVAPATPRETQHAVTPSATSRQGRTAKPQVARKAKAEHPAPAETETAATPDVAPAAEDIAPPVTKAAAKKAAATKWVDPWAN